MTIWVYYIPFHGHDETLAQVGSEAEASSFAEIFPGNIYFFQEEE